MTSKSKRVDEPKALRLPFNTDPGACYGKSDCGLLGPDGPWQAPIFNVGDGLQVPLYPSLYYGNVILTPKNGGLYDPSNSSTARKTGLSPSRQPMQDDVLQTQFVSQTASSMTSYFDSLEFPSEFSDDSMTVNTTLFAASDWKYNTANGSSYSPSVGYVGLDAPREDAKLPPSLLDQVKSQGKINTKAVSLHLASAKFQQTGSFILGGYDKSRVIGSPGVWPKLSHSIYLKDVTLGVEEGGSPFKIDTLVTKDTPLSIWQGLGGNKVGADIIRGQSGVEGSAIVQPMASLPSIYLPIGNCEAAAKHLPVTWRDDIGYYTWNVDDPQYMRIVSSPAYLGFVLSTPEAKNVTIKVAFALLNLTLESPIVATPTQYFPCHPTDSQYGVWILGRAFMQAAFWAMDYEKNQQYIGQGPGPRHEQLVLKPWPTNESTLETSPADSYASTWRPHWTALPEEGKSSDSLSGGVIAGIVVGIVAGLAIFAGVVWWFMRRRRDAVKEKEKDTGDSRDDDKEIVAHSASPGHQLSVSTLPAEAIGPERRHELSGKRAVYEMPGSQAEVIEVKPHRATGR
ncbi:hypothetical protein PWT90_01720 [Aphanocladium album]|nr:hypothetical protein PWT90_01720 [Aphanocladium album]